MLMQIQWGVKKQGRHSSKHNCYFIVKLAKSVKCLLECAICF